MFNFSRGHVSNVSKMNTLAERIPFPENSLKKIDYDDRDDNDDNTAHVY